MIFKTNFFSIIFIITALSPLTIFGMEMQQSNVNENLWREVLLFKKEYHLNCFKLISLYKKIYAKKYPSPNLTKKTQEIDPNNFMALLLFKSYINLYQSYLKLSSMCHQSICQKLNLNPKQKLLTGPPTSLSYSLEDLDFFSSLKQIFSKKDLSHVQTNLNDIKSDLVKLIKYLKENDLKNDLWLQEDIDKKSKQIWNDFLRLHNYNWLDRILYPYHPNIDDETEAKYLRQQSLSLHPDKQQDSIFNQSQKDEFFKTCLTNPIRPTKPLDYIVNPIIEGSSLIGSKITLQTSAQMVATTIFLPSILFPQYFTNKAINSLQEDTQKQNLETKHYGSALTKHKTAIKNHESMIKKKECIIRKKQENIREIVTTLFSKNKKSNN